MQYNFWKDRFCVPVTKPLKRDDARLIAAEVADTGMIAGLVHNGNGYEVWRKPVPDETVACQPEEVRGGIIIQQHPVANAVREIYTHDEKWGHVRTK